MNGTNDVVRSVTRGAVTVHIVQGDLTREPVDAIVNAANSDLLHGGGVAGAIVRAGGQVIQDESFQAAPVPIGGAGVTTAGSLPARFVIHTVGPRWGIDGIGEEADRLLARAIHSSLSVAAKPERNITSVSFPAISTGIFGYPVDRAARVSLAAVRDWLDNTPGHPLREIRFCLFGKDITSEFLAALDESGLGDA